MKKLASLTVSLAALSLISVGLLQQGLVATRADYVCLSNYSTYTLPSTINLNDCSQDEITSYYSGLDGRDLSGENLLKALKPILKNGQRYNSYDQTSNNAIWRAYEITDRDWSLSPAEEITNGSYDSSTNIITGYKYRKDGGDDPYCHLLYRNRGVKEARQTAQGHHGDNNGTDREHIWPKSRGFGKDSEGNEWKVPGARGDLHHLLAGDSYVNSVTHNNYAYGYVDRSKVTNNAGEIYLIESTTVVNGNYRGTSATFGKTLGADDVFEPQDCDKGDIARACFYMVARYNNLAMDDDTCDAGNPNLFLEDTVDTTTIMSNSSTKVSVGILRDLLAWHKADPVDEYEIHRNNLIYRNFDHNRNPFIDYPEWVDYIWGTSVFDADTNRVISYDATPTGSVNLSADVINGYRPEGGNWKKADWIEAGQQAAIVTTADGGALFGALNASPGYAQSVSVTLGNDSFEEESPNHFLVEDGSSEGIYAFKNGNQYLSYSGSSTGFDYIPEKTELSSWGVSITNGDASIHNVSKTTRFIRYSTRTSPYRFACYSASGDGYYDVQIYSPSNYVDATKWAISFLNSWLICDENGVSSSINWSDATTAYNALSISAKAYICSQAKNETWVGRALARYDYVQTKYRLEDFLTRNPSASSPQSATMLLEEDENTLLSGVLLSMVSVVSVGLAFLLRRRN